MHRALLALALALPVTAHAGAAASQPGPPASGPGSTDAYVASTATVYRTGRAAEGLEIWGFVPDVLRDGASAPVVVYLHGFSLPSPQLHRDHIEHLLAQGLIVLFPQFNKTGLAGLLSDNDQNEMLARAIGRTNLALAQLGPTADRSQIYLYGHSLGGLLAYAWLGAGGPDVAGMVLANPSFDSSQGLPPFVQQFVQITEIDWRALAPAVDVPVLFLAGNGDTIAPTGQVLDAWAALSNAPSAVVYEAQSDPYGTDDLSADHLAPLQSSAGIPSFLFGLFGGDASVNAFDSRYYYAALDALIAGDVAPTFDMGSWSDGTPVQPVLTLAP